MKFRKANQRDVDALQNFAASTTETRTVFGHSLGREFFRSIIRTGLVYVALSDNKDVLGYLLAEADARIQFSNIIHMSLHPEASKEELVQGLLEKHYEECQKMNISDIALHTTELGKKNLDLLSNLGFAPEKKFMMLTRQVEGF
jgi:N-acetylglutamate synthase-like GNAT family acetyltransferase